MSRLLQTLALLALAHVAGVVGAMIGPWLTRSGVPEPHAPPSTNASPIRETQALEARLARLEAEAARPRLAGADLGARLARLEARLAALEARAAKEAPAAPKTTTSQDPADAEPDRPSRLLDELLAEAREPKGARTERRLERWRAVLAMDPPPEVRIEAWQAVAQAHRTLKQWEEAEVAYSEVVEAAGPHSRKGLHARYDQAVMQMVQGDTARARETTLALARDPHVQQPLVSHAWFDAGKFAEEMGDRDEAKQAYRRVLEGSRDSTLGVVEYLAERAQERLDALEDAPAGR